MTRVSNFDGDGSPLGRTDTDAPFLVAASLSGEADAEWARAAGEYVDVAIMGGIALDPASRAAARDLVARDRSEFLPESPIGFLTAQLRAVDDEPVRPGFNVRSATVDPIREAAAVCADHGAVCEINAHCRQPELCAVGCGESLLKDVDRLGNYVAAAVDAGEATGTDEVDTDDGVVGSAGTDDAGVTTSVKVRTEVSGVDLVDVAETVAAAGADWLHVDAMDSERVIADLASAIAANGWDLTLVANNGVRDRDTVGEYAAHGADAVSVGRPSDDPRVLSRVADAVDVWREGEFAAATNVDERDRR